ncbi:polysaccharide deacetylase family protein [Pelosinus baikalensis]|uniref:Polysaccharide deacetylase family protein n=1 Tax=Pelosinus baikalensis TaxID=2892015 RepID=A0ABS8HWE5_9FIRM|nr:polysaccharide deacetylase family protein [Pelosinus baikalensis]MCC5467479.1 polysaccharide deacetylase family protein [Pelosinus baikalensis]
MFDLNIRLINMLGLLTIIVIAGLVLDYRNVLKKPMRIGMSLAILGITAGIFLTLSAVLPENHVFGRVFSNTKTTQKVVALTFDDGPYPPYTEQVLDVLKEYHVPATFFVVGQNVDKYPELVKRIADEGHQIGNHTYHHIDLLKANRKVIAEEIDNANKAILAAAGIKPHLMRPPHGFRDPVVMEMMAERNLKVVEWSVMSRDWTNPGVDVIVERTVKKVKNGSIILLHDGDGITSQASRIQSVEAARRIIQILSEQGYTFVTVDEILEKTEDVKG